MMKYINQVMCSLLFISTLTSSYASCQDLPSNETGNYYSKDRSIQIPLTDHVIANDSVEILIYDGLLDVKTMEEKWSYAVIFPLDYVKILSGPVYFTINTKITTGKIGFGILNSSETEFLVERQVSEQNKFIDIHIPLGSLKHASKLVIRNCNENGKASKLIISNISINPNYISCKDDVDTTEVLLKELIYKDVPELKEGNPTEWETVNLLRDWVSKYADISITEDSLLTNNHCFLSLYEKSASDLFAAFFEDLGGVQCGGTAIVLSKLYKLFGFNSYCLNTGFINTRFTHVYNLVEISYRGKNLLSLQDAYFNHTVVNSDSNPMDYYDFLKKLVDMKCEEIFIKNRLPIIRNILLTNDPMKLTSPKFHCFTPIFIGTTQNNFLKYTINFDIDTYIKCSIDEELYDLLEKNNLPGNLLYLNLLPIGISGANSEDIWLNIMSVLGKK